MITMTLNTREFRQAMLGVHRDTGWLVEFIVADQMALWAKDLLRSTLPSSNLLKGGKKASGGKDKKVGMEAVRKDLSKIFEPVRDPTLLQKWKDDTDAGSIIYRNTKRGKMKIDRELLRLTMKGFHSMHRNKVTGRTWLKPIRDQAWSGKMPVPQPEFNKYLKLVQKDIGKTKAGWLPGCYYFSAKTNGRVKPIPNGYAWVVGHGSPGTATQTTNRAQLSSRGEEGNSVPWVRDTGFMASTKRTRLADLNGPYYRKRLERVLKKYSAR